MTSAKSPFYQLLNTEQVIQLEPQIRQFKQGYYFPTEAQLDNQTLLIKLKKYLKSSVKWENQSVLAVSPGKITLNNQTQKFDCTFDCRGLGAQAIFPTLRAIRGELIWLKAPQVSIKRPIRLLHPRYSLYVVPRPQQIYLIGASEIEANDTSPISVRSTLELLTAAYYLHPGFSEARIIRTVTHTRPVLPNHSPLLKYTTAMVAINGLYRHGFLIAPTLAREVIQWLEQGANGRQYPQLWEVL